MLNRAIGHGADDDVRSVRSVGSFGFASSVYSEVTEDETEQGGLPERTFTRSINEMLMESPSALGLDQLLRRLQTGDVADREGNHYTVCEVWA